MKREGAEGKLEMARTGLDPFPCGKGDVAGGCSHFQAKVVKIPFGEFRGYQLKTVVQELPWWFSG